MFYKMICTYDETMAQIDRFYFQQPVAALAPLFFADPAGAVVGKFFSKRGLNRAWYENKTVMGTLAVLLVAYLRRLDHISYTYI